MTTDEPEQEFPEASAEAQRVMQRADGFLDLKLWQRARAELECLPQERRESLLYYLLLLRLAFGEEDWKSAVKWADALRKGDPGVPEYWVQFAYATRRTHDIHSARNILVEAIEKFPSEAIIPYNLACYACSSGDVDLARAYLRTAFSLELAYRDIALEDEGLESMWDEIEDLPGTAVPPPKQAAIWQGESIILTRKHDHR
jgi:tetratricopeptide (TPR) repeat protein